VLSWAALPSRWRWGTTTVLAGRCVAATFAAVGIRVVVRYLHLKRTCSAEEGEGAEEEGK